jgi:hypothetical protein
VRRFFQLNTDYLVFAILVAIAVAGRIDRVDWNFTPVAAAALFAGFYFRNRLIAALVPLTALAISDLFEPAHNNQWVALTVWTAMLLPAMLGPWLRAAQDKWAKIGRGTVSALLPSAFFFLVTNFAVWVTAPYVVGADYANNLNGLAACYAAAVPFYGKMLVGDLFYMTVLFGAYAVAMRGAIETKSEISY